MTRSAHDATAFEHTTAAKYPDWLFEGEEFTWADSAFLVLVVLGGIIDREKVLLIIGQVKTVVCKGVWNTMVMERFFMRQNVTRHISITPDIEKMLI